MVWLFLAYFALCGDESFASDPACAPPVLEDEIQLDAALEQSRFVFVASVVVNDADTTIFDYVLHPPALRGQVPQAGTLNIVDGCSYVPLLNGGAIILLFLNTLDEAVSHENAVLVALSTNEPGYSWVANWLMNNTSEQ